MDDQPVQVQIESGSETPVVVEAMLHRFTSGERLQRALRFFGLAVLLTVPFLLVPIIHFLAPPMILIVGGVVAFKLGKAKARLHAMKFNCPKCQAVNRLGGGIGVVSVGAPRERNCESCRRVLRITILTAGGAQG